MKSAEYIPGSMNPWLRFANAINRLNHVIGRATAWLTVLMILAGVWNAVGRYIGKAAGLTLSSNAWLELQWYLFSLVFLLGAAYTLRYNGHVRVDVIYARLSPRTHAWINVLGGVFFLIPFTIVGVWLTWTPVKNSWAVLEKSPDPGGLPRFPIKTALLLAFGLLFLQGLAEVIRQIAYLKGLIEEPAEEPEMRGEGV